MHRPRERRQGIKTFLGFMDPTLDHVGFAVFPPAINRNSLCETPRHDAKRYGYDTWWPEWIPGPADQTPGVYAIGSLVDDYLIRSGSSWALNPGSSLIQLVDCTQSADTVAYSTSYSNAIEEAQHELDEHGRGNVQDVIVFMSDGAANVTPRRVPDYLDNPADRAGPCGAGIKAAAQAKARGTIVYTIGYDLNGFGTDYERCRNANTGEEEGITAFDAMKQIATEERQLLQQARSGPAERHLHPDCGRPAAASGPPYPRWPPVTGPAHVARRSGVRTGVRVGARARAVSARSGASFGLPPHKCMAARKGGGESDAEVLHRAPDAGHGAS